MLPNPGNQRRELLRRALREHPAEPNQVGAEVPESVDWLVREPGVLSWFVKMAGGRDRAGEVLVAQPRITHVVRHQTERRSNVKLQSAVLAAKLAASVVPTAARTRACLDKGETVRTEDGGEYRRAFAKYFDRIHNCSASQSWPTPAYLQKTGRATDGAVVGGRAAASICTGRDTSCGLIQRLVSLRF